MTPGIVPPPTSLSCGGLLDLCLSTPLACYVISSNFLCFGLFTPHWYSLNVACIRQTAWYLQGFLSEMEISRVVKKFHVYGTWRFITVSPSL